MNENLHLTDEQLDRLRAGLDEAVWTSHLNACADCQARFHAWRGLCPTADAALAGELATRRAHALAQAHTQTPARHARWHYPALAATLAAVSVGLWMFLSPAPTALTVAEQGQADVAPDVYADLDFYLWLSQQSREEQGEANSS